VIVISLHRWGVIVDTDSIGLIVLIIAVALVLVLGWRADRKKTSS
jgi:hypothetical protein